MVKRKFGKTEKCLKYYDQDCISRSSKSKYEDWGTEFIPTVSWKHTADSDTTKFTIILLYLGQVMDLQGMKKIEITAF